MLHRNGPEGARSDVRGSRANVCLSHHVAQQRVHQRERRPLLVLLPPLLLLRPRVPPRRRTPPFPIHQAGRHPRSPKLQRNPARPRAPQGPHRRQGRRQGLVCQRTKSAPPPLRSSPYSPPSQPGFLGSTLPSSSAHSPSPSSMPLVIPSPAPLRTCMPPSALASWYVSTPFGACVSLTSLQIYGFSLYQSRITMIRKRDPGHYGPSSSLLRLVSP